jgi:hypothetical protein
MVSVAVKSWNETKSRESNRIVMASSLLPAAAKVVIS